VGNHRKQGHFEAVGRGSRCEDTALLRKIKIFVSCHRNMVVDTTSEALGIERCDN
jgi:hypothetical protein